MVSGQCKGVCRRLVRMKEEVITASIRSIDLYTRKKNGKSYLRLGKETLRAAGIRIVT